MSERERGGERAGARAPFSTHPLSSLTSLFIIYLTPLSISLSLSKKDCTLHQHLQARTIPGRGLPPTDAARWGVALFSALATVHAAGLVHRDVKPENLLLRGGAGGGRVGGELKLADFGLARRVPGLGKVAAGVPPSSSPADAAAAPPADGASAAAVSAADAADAAGPLTAYVSTRWYRSPEVLLRCGGSGVTSASSAGAKPPPPPIGPPSDVWAAALVLAEMLGGRPLFPGASEGDQLARLAAGLGPPSGAGWGPQARAAAAAAGLPLAALGEEEVAAAAAAAAARVGGSAEAGRARAVQWLAGALPRGTPRPALDFLAACLAWDPAARPSAAAALAHPFLAGGGVGGGGKAAAPVVAAVAAVPAAAVPTAADPYWLVRWSPFKPVVAVAAAAVAHAGVTATLRVGGGGVKAAASGPPPPPPVPSSSSSTCADLAAAAALLAEAVAVVGAAAPPEGLALAAAVEQVRAQRRAAAKAAKVAAGRSSGAAWAAAAAAAAAPAGVSV